MCNTPSPRLALPAWALCLAAACALAPTPAAAQWSVLPPSYPVLRPALEYTTWVALGGGALVTPNATPGFFDLRVGGDFTAALGRDGDLRLGPFAEVATSSFAGVSAVGGVELFVGAAPRSLRMFYYTGEGVFAARLGAGWSARGADLGGARGVPVASLTLAWGYRAPFSLRDWRGQTSTEHWQRAPNRYMTGVRLWVNTTVDLASGPAWQMSGGIEFEPAGSFRYLLGMY